MKPNRTENQGQPAVAQEAAREAAQDVTQEQPSRLEALESRIEARGAVTLQEAAELARLRKQAKGF